MTAIGGSIINPMFEYGAYWMGIATSVTETHNENVAIESPFGTSFSRINFYGENNIGLQIQSILGKTYNTLLTGINSFNHFDYYKSKLASNNIILAQSNTTILTDYTFDIKTNSAITGSFNNIFFAPDQNILDLIEELENPVFPSGNEILVYLNEDLMIQVDDYEFNGINSINIQSNSVYPVLCTGGIYGYYLIPPAIKVSIQSYENHFVNHQNLFNNQLSNIICGPFTIIGPRFTNMNISVDAQGFKQYSLNLMAKNLIFEET